MLLPERKHDRDAPDEDRYLTIKYSIESSLGARENYRYRQVIDGVTMLQDEHGKDLEEIGRLYADKLLFSAGVDEGRGHFSIFDTEQYRMDSGSVVWDFGRNDFTPALLKFFHHDLIDTDILCIHTVEILPAYRGMQVGEHAMRDAANNFEQRCTFIAAGCLPLQHTNLSTDRNGERKCATICLRKENARPGSRSFITRSAPAFATCPKYRSSNCSGARPGEPQILITLNRSEGSPPFYGDTRLLVLSRFVRTNSHFQTGPSSGSMTCPLN